MRALLLSTEEIQKSELCIEAERYRHLIQVCRLKVGDHALLLDGQGTRAKGTITSIKKREAILEVSELEKIENEHFLDAVIGCPKKDAVEEILRRSVELGLRRLIFYESEFSNWMYEPNQRFAKIIESALIQSNNFWAPEILTWRKDELEASLAAYGHGIWLHPYPESFSSSVKREASGAVDVICIGPEAGWSSSECERLGSCSNLEPMALRTPIMRAEHALSVAAGYALALGDN